MDRRDRYASVSDGRDRSGLLRYGLIIGSALILAALCLGAGAMPAVDAVGLVAGLAFVMAGAALLVGWKVNGWAYCAWLGVAVINLGLLSIADRAIFGTAGPHDGLAYSLGSVLVTLIVAALVVTAIRAPEVESGLRPWRVLILSLGAGLLGLFALGHLASSAGGSIALRRVMLTGCALVWWKVASYALSRRATARHRNLSQVVAAIALLMAAADTFDTVISASGVGPMWPRLAGFVAAGAALLMSAYLLNGVLEGQDRYQFGLRVDLDVTRDRSQRDKAELDERLHDLRNAVTAVRTADAALRRYQADLDPETGEYLADAITAELHRLQTMVEPERPLEISEVVIDEALAPVIALARAGAMKLGVDIGSDLVLADADATARIVQNLLVNARVHAPGSAVELATRRVRDRVEVRVSDAGPGVAEADRASLFERGFRGRDSAGTDGSGVGLFTAARLAADMRGRLRLDSSETGATFVLELPACDGAQASEPVLASRTPSASRSLEHHLSG